MKQENWHAHQGIFDFAGLEKLNSIAFLEVNVINRKPLSGVKN